MVVSDAVHVTSNASVAIVLNDGPINVVFVTAVRAIIQSPTYLISINKSAIVEGSPFDTGTLRRSWTWRVEGDVGVVGTNVPYAAIQNFGGIIKARNAEYLTFKIKDRWVRVRMVQIPATNYIGNSIQTHRNNIVQEVVKQLYG